MDGWQEALKDDVKLVAMRPLSEDKLLTFLAEIQSDIRQIKSDLQTLLTLLQHQQKPTPVRPAEDDLSLGPTRVGQPHLKKSFAIA
jgi:hypothetical protein